MAAAAFLAALVIPACQTWEWIQPDLLRLLVRLADWGITLALLTGALAIMPAHPTFGHHLLP